MMGSEQALAAVRGRTGSLEVLLSSRDDASALDATSNGVTLLTSGAYGAVHIRDGQLVALSAAGTIAHWTLVRGDRVLLLSGALFTKARELGVGPLAANLATAEPVAWAQSVDVPARRLAVSVSLPTA